MVGDIVYKPHFCEDPFEEETDESVELCWSQSQFEEIKIP